MTTDRTEIFRLDDRLRNDTVSISDNDDLEWLLMDDRRFPWVIIVPKFAGITELYDLPAPIADKLHRQSLIVGKAMMQEFQGTKLNTGSLGNIVSQLHMHVVVRKSSDDAWPGPVWGHGSRQPYPPSELEKMITRLRLLIVRLTQ